MSYSVANGNKVAMDNDFVVVFFYVSAFHTWKFMG